MARATVVGLFAFVVAALAIAPTATAGGLDLAAAGVPADDDPGRQALGPDDGWAAAAGGTTGGSAAPDERVVVVRTRAELVAALAGNDPKLIYAEGTIDAGVDDNGRALACDDYAEPPYTRESYLAAYDPAVWGRAPVSGAQEEARARSAQRQTERVKINVGSNTTLIGVDGARLVGANLYLGGVDNVILRNLELIAPVDCFPQWDPNDGADGNWNSLYDAVSLVGATHVWIDHCAFHDGDHPDAASPSYFGRLYQQHDGLLDITRGSDLVTVSWSDFHDHDKAMLIGSTDNPRDDRGKLRVTLHDTRFANLHQRAPRVRFGQVHLYDNLYVAPDKAGYLYSWGVGVESAIYAEQQYVVLGPDLTPADLIGDYGGTMIQVAGTVVEQAAQTSAVDVVAAYNAAHQRQLAPVVDWAPALHGPITPADELPQLIPASVGPTLTVRLPSAR